MIAADEQRLPPSIGGLADYAFAAVGERAGLSLLLAAGVFAAEALVEFALPGYKPDTPQGDFKLMVLLYVSVFATAYAIAATALGVGARLTGEAASSRRIAGAALQRWLGVTLTSVIVVTVMLLTNPLSALGPLPERPAFLVFTAPLIWLLWGALALAPPIAALSGERPGLAAMLGLARAVSLSLRGYNLVRLCLVAFVSIVPNLLQTIALDAMLHGGHVARPYFWSSAPIDALTIVPVAALQTVFAIDLARRAGQRAA